MGRCFRLRVGIWRRQGLAEQARIEQRGIAFGVEKQIRSEKAAVPANVRGPGMAKGDVERLPSGRMSPNFPDHQPKTQLDPLAMRGMDIGRKLEGKQDLARVVGHADDCALRVQRKEFGEIMNQVADGGRSEEHTSELQSLMRIAY